MPVLPMFCEGIFSQLPPDLLPLFPFGIEADVFRQNVGAVHGGIHGNVGIKIFFSPFAHSVYCPVKFGLVDYIPDGIGY